MRLSFVPGYRNGLWVWFKAKERKKSERRRKKGILPEDLKLFFFPLFSSAWLTFSHSDSLQPARDVVAALPKSYPGRAIERALSKYTLDGFSPPLHTCSAPVQGAVPHLSPDHSPFRDREKNKAQDRRDVCLCRAAASSPQYKCPETAHSCPGIHACLPSRVLAGGTEKAREAGHRLHDVMHDTLLPSSSGICLTGSFVILY